MHCIRIVPNKDHLRSFASKQRNVFSFNLRYTFTVRRIYERNYRQVIAIEQYSSDSNKIKFTYVKCSLKFTSNDRETIQNIIFTNTVNPFTSEIQVKLFHLLSKGFLSRCLSVQRYVCQVRDHEFLSTWRLVDRTLGPITGG